MKKIVSYSAFLGAVLLTCLVLAMPLIVHWQLETRLSETFAEPVSLDDLSLRPFKGRVVLSGLQIGETMRVDEASAMVSLSDLFDSRLVIESLNVEGVQLPLAITPQQLVIGKLIIPLGYSADDTVADEGAEEAFFSDIIVEQVQLEDVTLALDYVGNRHQLQLTRLDINNLTPDLRLPLEYNAVLSLDGNDLTAAGKVQRREALPGYALEASLALRLDLADIAAYAPTALGGELVLDQQLQLETRETLAGTDIDLTAEGSVVLKDLTEADSGLRLQSVNWSGETTMKGAAGNLAVNARGDVSGNGLALSQPRDLALDQWRWSGNLGINILKEARPVFDAQGELGLEGISLSPFGRVDAVELKALRYSPAAVVADSLNIAGVDILVSINADGELDGLPLMPVAAEGAIDIVDAASGESVAAPSYTTVESAAGTAAESGPAVVSAAETALPAIDIKQLNVTGQMMFRDQSVSPAVAITLKQIEMTATGIVSGEDAQISLNALHQEENQTGNLSVTGTVQVLEAPISADLKAKLTQFEMYQLSAYLKDGIRSGRLTLDSTVTISGAQLKAENRVRIAGLRVDTRADQASVGGGLSLAMALNMLKDSDNMIDLDVPVESDTDNFSIDTSDIINTALANAARRAAISYATQALQPLGTLLLLKDVAGIIARPRFEPVTFEPGSASLDDKALAYAGKLAELLIDRPALTLTVCGYATARDRLALEQAALAETSAVQADVVDVTEVQQAPESADPAASNESASPVIEQKTLLALAEERALLLSRAIQVSGITDQRLFDCRPAFDKEDSAPRVEISL